MLNTLLLLTGALPLVLAIYILWVGIKLFKTGPKENLRVLHGQRLCSFQLELYRHVSIFQWLSWELEGLNVQCHASGKDEQILDSIKDLATRSSMLIHRVGSTYDQMAAGIKDLTPYFSEPVVLGFQLFLNQATQVLYPAQELSVQLDQIESLGTLAGIPRHFIDPQEEQRLWEYWHEATRKLFAEINASVEPGNLDFSIFTK